MPTYIVQTYPARETREVEAATWPEACAQVLGVARVAFTERYGNGSIYDCYERDPYTRMAHRHIGRVIHIKTEEAT